MTQFNFLRRFALALPLSIVALALGCSSEEPTPAPEPKPVVKEAPKEPLPLPDFGAPLAAKMKPLIEAQLIKATGDTSMEADQAELINVLIRAYDVEGALEYASQALDSNQESDLLFLMRNRAEMYLNGTESLRSHSRKSPMLYPDHLKAEAFGQTVFTADLRDFYYLKETMEQEVSPADAIRLETLMLLGATDMYSPGAGHATDFSKHLKELEEASAANPKSAGLYFFLAIAHEAAKDNTKAIAALDMAIEINGEYFDALVMRSRLRAKGNDAAGAKSDYDAALLAFPYTRAQLESIKVEAPGPTPSPRLGFRAESVKRRQHRLDAGWRSLQLARAAALQSKLLLKDPKIDSREIQQHQSTAFALIEMAAFTGFVTGGLKLFAEDFEIIKSDKRWEGIEALMSRHDLTMIVSMEMIEVEPEEKQPEETREVEDVGEDETEVETID